MASIATLEEVKEKAVERFRALPWPVKTDEEWRRTDLAQIPKINDLEGSAPGFEVEVEPPAPALIQRGVIVTHLTAARKQFPQLLEENLSRAGRPEGLLKFAAQHEAFFEEGLFCYVPAGVRVETPLSALIKRSPQAGQAIFPRTLIVLGQGAELILIEEKRSDGNGAGTLLSNEMVEIYLEQEAKLKYIQLQRWASDVFEILSQRAVLERDAQLLHVAVGLGGKLTKANIEAALTGSGARSDLLGIFLGSGKRHFDFHTLQDHQAPQTTSDLLYKSALMDEAEAIYTGLIRIRKQAQKSDAYQANRNLLLSQGAKADSIPMLEIEADDVRCTHGVAVGPVDEEQSFYLMSRGLSEAKAQQLIVEGFFDQVFQRIPSEKVKEGLMEEVSQRLEPALNGEKGRRE